MDNATVAELEQHALALRGRLRAITDDIRALLAEDLPKFAERELKREFVANPAFASSVSDKRLRELKTTVAEQAQAVTASIITALESEDLWAPGVVPEDPRASIAENAALWAEVSRIAATVDQIRSTFGFPNAETPTAYNPPTWFIGRRYLPALSEKYWSVVRELSETETRAERLKSEASKSELSNRWDDA